MGIAALFVGILVALAIVSAIVYGTVVGLAHGWRFLWRNLVQEQGSPIEWDSGQARVVPCWEEKECPPSVRQACPAYLRRQEDLPCWLANLQSEGKLRVSCLTCERFSIKELVA